MISIMRYSAELIVAAATCWSLGAAWLPGPKVFKSGSNKVLQINKRQLPAEPTGIQSFLTPSGVNITYKEVGGDVCETTPGVASYAGFVNVAPDAHSFVSSRIPLAIFY